MEVDVKNGLVAIPSGCNKSTWFLRIWKREENFVAIDCDIIKLGRTEMFLEKFDNNEVKITSTVESEVWVMPEKISMLNINEFIYNHHK